MSEQEQPTVAVDPVIEGAPAAEVKVETKEPSVPETPLQKALLLDIGAPITENGASRHPGTLRLSTYTRKELMDWITRVEKQIEVNQESRIKEVTEQSNKVPYFKLVYDKDTDAHVWLTETERTILDSIRQSLLTLYTGVDESSFLDSETISNLPKVKLGDVDIPITIMHEKYDQISDPVLKVKVKMGLCISRNIPLWNSGFRVEIEGPSAMELLNLDTQLTMEKIQTSMDTYGYALTSVNVFMDRLLIEFMLKSVTRSTAGTIDPDRLLRMISYTDYDTLVLGTASAMFPDGYNLERTVFREKGGQITPVEIKSKLNTQRMLGVKASRFTFEQKRSLAKTKGNIPAEELKKHRLGIRPEVDNYIQLKDGMWIKLYVPTLYDYLRVGMTWHTRMQDRVQQVLSSTVDEESRKIFIARASEIARVMYLAHWIEGFYDAPSETSAEPTPIEGLVRLDPDLFDTSKVGKVDEAIEAILEDVSVDPEMCELILERINQYNVQMRTTSVILPRDPNAKAAEGEHPKVITLNPVEIFFTLLRHKILQAGG